MGNDNISISQLTLNELRCFLIALEDIQASLQNYKNQCILKHLGQLFNYLPEWNLIFLQIALLQTTTTLHISYNQELNEVENSYKLFITWH